MHSIRCYHVRDHWLRSNYLEQMTSSLEHKFTWLKVPVGYRSFKDGGVALWRTLVKELQARGTSMPQSILLQRYQHLSFLFAETMAGQLARQRLNSTEVCPL